MSSGAHTLDGMSAALPEGWLEFGVAAAGATAALAGLLIVAMSVNVKQILASKALMHGARSTIASLVLAIVTSLLLLIPGQSLLLLGVEALVITVPAVGIQLQSILTQSRTSAEGITPAVLAFIIAFAVLQYAPFLIGGILLLFGVAAGVWLLAAGVVIVVIASLVNAWVLLLEVQA
jgi:modulator of FtsH protease